MTMQFRQRRQFFNSNFRYDLRYDISNSSLDEEIIRLESKLRLISGDNQPISDSVLVQSTKNLIPSKTEIHLLDRGTDVSLDLSLLSTDKEEKLILNVSIEGSYRTYHLKFPAVKALQICRKLANKEKMESTLEAAESHYNKERTDTCYSILEDASHCLDYEDYLAVRDSLVGEEPRLEETVERDRYASIRNMVMGRSKGKYFKINSASELWRRVNTYNEYDNLKNIDKSELVKHILETKYIKKQTSRYSPSKLDELRKVIFDPEFVEAVSEITGPYFAAYCADLLRHDKFELVSELIETWVDSSESLNYEDELERLLDTDEITLYNRRAELFRRLLPEATQRDNQSLKFVAANYLFWRARDYSSKPEAETELELEKVLFSVSGELAEDVGDISFIREQAQYFEALTEGHIHKFEDHNKAAEEYLDALAIAQNEESAWVSSRYYYLIPPLRNRAESMANQFDNDQEYAEASEYLQSQIEVLESWEDVDENQREVAISRLEGFKLEHEAHELLQSKPVGEIIDEAKGKFGRASQCFDKAEAKELQAGALGRIKELEALEAEFEGEFKTAAQAHAEYCEKNPNTRGAKYHNLAEITCLVKYQLVENEPEEAKEQMEELESKSEPLSDAHMLLGVLVDLFYDYQNESTTDENTVFDTIANTSTNEDHPLAIQTNYHTGISQLLAAQRLRETSNGDLLDNLVKESIRDALIPADIDQYSLDYIEKSFPLQHASLGDWKKELPKNVYDRIWAIEQDQESAFDYDSLVSGLFTALERLLTAVVEYYCTLLWRRLLVSHSAVLRMVLSASFPGFRNTSRRS